MSHTLQLESLAVLDLVFTLTSLLYRRVINITNQLWCTISVFAQKYDGTDKKMQMNVVRIYFIERT